MKKFFKKLMCFTLAITTVFAMTACGGENDEEDDGRRVLKWEVLKAGYGTIPYEKLAEAYMEKNPEVLVKINFNPSITDTTASRLESKTNVADVYSFKSMESIKRWIASGWVESLDDVYESELSTGKTIKESATGNSVEACSYNGKTYAIPEYMSVNGFVYNKSLFDEHGWKVPTTTTELEKLCKQIISDTNGSVAPIVYCGGAADGYLYFAVENWVYQYEGIDNLNKFYEFGSADVFNPSNYKGKMYGLQNLQKFFFDEGNYTMAGSTGMTHIVAQSKLIKGEAAMMLNGSWFENEMSEVLSQNPDVEMGMFAVPESSDASGKVLHSSNYKTEDGKRVIQADYGSYYFVPTSASNKDDAKDFLRFLSEPEACEIYTRYTNAIRPFEYELSADADAYKDMSTFGKSVLGVASENYLYAKNVTNPIAIKGLTGFWARGTTPYVDIRDGVETINQALQNDYDYAVNNWNSWLEMMN